MAKSKRIAVRKYHDRVAGRYDDSYTDQFWQWHDALTWDYLKPFLPTDQGAKVVDLGCGTGKWAAKLAKSGYQTTCLDISPKMLEQARATMTNFTGSKAPTFIQADLCDMSAVESSQFDLAVAMGDPVGCATDTRLAMREIRRILRPHGLLVGTIDNKLAAIDYYLDKGKISETVRFLRDGKTHWLTRDKSEQFPIATFTPKELEKLLRSTGFEMVDLVGKTVLPMRHYRTLLDHADDRRSWAKVEKSLCRDSAAIGRASHLQFAARVSAK